MVNATLRLLYPMKRDPVTTVQEAGWASEPVWTGAENLAPTGIRSPDRPVRRQSLYRQNYPGPRSRLCVADKKSTHARNETPVLQSNPNGQYTP